MLLGSKNIDANWKKFELSHDLECPYLRANKQSIVQLERLSIKIKFVINGGGSNSAFDFY